MPRPKFQTLTEQMFYILLCLKTECYGIDLFDRIAEMTDKRVTVGSGTLYSLKSERRVDMISEMTGQNV